MVIKEVRTMEIVKLKIITRNTIAQWKCPKCGKTNTEYNYRRTVVHCYGCGKQFKGEFEEGGKK